MVGINGVVGVKGWWGSLGVVVGSRGGGKSRGCGISRGGGGLGGGGQEGGRSLVEVGYRVVGGSRGGFYDVIMASCLN